MTVFFLVIGFFVWFLVGLLTSMVCAGFTGEDWGRINDIVIVVLILTSLIGGPMLWVILYVNRRLKCGRKTP